MRPNFSLTPWLIAWCVLFSCPVAILLYRERRNRARELSQAMLAERSRFARELHDTLIQGCASVSAMLEAASACDPGDNETRQHMIDYANTQVRATMDEARQAVWNLRKGEEAWTDLATCIAQSAERLSREYGVRMDCQTEGKVFPIRQPETHELMMVVREAFFNAVLHGHATAIVAELTFSKHELDMVISDNGRGFDMTRASWEGHYGLQGMRERVQGVGGSLWMGSLPQHGTWVWVNISRAKLCADPGVNMSKQESTS